MKLIIVICLLCSLLTSLGQVGCSIVKNKKTCKYYTNIVGSINCLLCIYVIYKIFSMKLI